MKKLMFLMIIFVMVLSACAPAATQAPAPVATEAPAPVATEAPVAPQAPVATEAPSQMTEAPAASGVKELTILWAEWDPAKYLQEIGNMYEKETGVKVNVVEEPWGSFY